MRIVRYSAVGSAESGYGELVDDQIHVLRDSPFAGGDVDQRTGEVVPLENADLLAPVGRPGKIICIGLNYRDHAEEAGLPVPTEPLVFAKHSTAVVGPGAMIRVPGFVDRPDWEAELAVVIGREGASIAAVNAMDHVLGFTCFNDVSARDIQAAESQWVRAKSFDTFAPMGPWITTADAIQDPQDLGIRCLINDEVIQDSRTSQMVFSVAEIIEFVSRQVTLLPGDVIATGTPPGVGVGMTPPRFLQDGDVVTVEIESIGQLSNQVSRMKGIHL